MQGRMEQRTRGHDLAQGLDLAFFGVGVTTFGGVLAAGWVKAAGGTSFHIVGLASACLLVCTIMGASAKGAAELTHRGAIARIYAQALQGFRDPAVERRGPRRISVRQRLADLAGGLLASLRLRFISRDELTGWVIEMRDQIALRGAVAAQMGASLTSDTHIITDAATAVYEADTSLARQIQAAKLSLDEAAAALSRLSQTMAMQNALVPGMAMALSTLKSRLADAQHAVGDLAPPAASRLDSVSEVRRAVERLPAYSEAMETILRGLPELAALG